jgi:hypothetical protein
MRTVFSAMLALFVSAQSVLVAQTFHGDSCTQDCSGHEAGYEWAERRGIDNIDDCGGNSSSFIEGCQTYVEENATTEQDGSGGNLVREE